MKEAGNIAKLLFSRTSVTTELVHPLALEADKALKLMLNDGEIFILSGSFSSGLLCHGLPIQYIVDFHSNPSVNPLYAFVTV